MFSTYREVFRAPGSVGFSSAAFVARLPIAMLGIVVVLLVATTSGGYALAGAVSAVFSLASAIGQPLLSRLADRYGQAKAVAPQVVVATAGSVALVWLVSIGAASWTFFVAAAVAGASYPNMGALVRARWSATLGGTKSLRIAYSWESVLDELIFVLGPPFIIVLAGRIGPGTAMLAAAALLVVGSFLFLGQRGTEPVAAGHPTMGRPAALSLPGLRVVTLVLFMLGGVFGAVEVIAVAFSDERHEPNATAIVLSLYAAGSMISGLIYGTRTIKTPLPRQLARLCCLVPVTLAGFPFANTTPVLGGLALVAGVLVAPTLITAFQLVERTVPNAQLTEGLSWATTGITAGASLAAALAGVVIDAVGTPRAFWVSSGFALGTAAVALIGIRWLSPAAVSEDIGSGDTTAQLEGT